VKINYKEINFGASSLQTIDLANQILEEYADRGIVVTLRQLYYQFVSRGAIANKQTEYKRLGSIINDARMAGLVDWEALQDRTRNLVRRSSWGAPEDVIRSAAKAYHRDYWSKQRNRVEVWIEKDALVGVIEDVCHEYDVAYFSCRGYTSASEMWHAAMRVRHYQNMGNDVTILHLGDHDPSGKDMTRDIKNRLFGFGADVEVRRIALNIDQVRRYQPPPNPAKTTDSRAADYIAEFGDESWELDALPPDALVDLVRDEIWNLVDGEKFDEVRAEVEEERAVLTATYRNWTAVSSYVAEKWMTGKEAKGE
jgi:hypothetical protein